MQLSDLSEEEQHVFGGLIRLLLRSDGDFSQAEETMVDSLGARIGDGPGSLWNVISESAQNYPDDAQIRRAAPSVTRPAARDFMLGVLDEIAASDGLAQEETKLIEWVRTAWAGN